MSKYTQYRPMSLWRPELKLVPETPVGGNTAQVCSKQPRNSFPCPQPDGRSFVTFHQPVYDAVSSLTVSAAVRLREPPLVGGSPLALPSLSSRSIH